MYVNLKLFGVCCFVGFCDRIWLRVSCFGVVEVIYCMYYVVKIL